MWHWTIFCMFHIWTYCFFFSICKSRLCWVLDPKCLWSSQGTQTEETKNIAPLILKTLHIHPTSLEIPLSINTVHNYNQMCYLWDMWPLFYFYTSRRDDSTDSLGKRNVHAFYNIKASAILSCVMPLWHVCQANQHTLTMHSSVAFISLVLLCKHVGQTWVRYR